MILFNNLWVFVTLDFINHITHDYPHVFCYWYELNNIANGSLFVVRTFINYHRTIARLNRNCTPDIESITTTHGKEPSLEATELWQWHVNLSHLMVQLYAALCHPQQYVFEETPTF